MTVAGKRQQESAREAYATLDADVGRAFIEALLSDTVVRVPRHARHALCCDRCKPISRKSQDRPALNPSQAALFEHPSLRTSGFSSWTSGSLRRFSDRQVVSSRRGGMSTHTPTGFNWAEALQPLEARRQARVVASFAEYLAQEVLADLDRALEAMASLAEWCNGDRELLVQARADVLRDTRQCGRPSLRTTGTPSSCWTLRAD